MQTLLAKTLRLFFKLLYHQFSWTYDWVATFVSVGMWQDWVRSALDHVDGENILEVGHGPGHLQKALRRKGYNPIGLDRSPQMGRRARSRLRGAGFPTPLLCADALQLPFPANHFDSIIATFPAEYIAAPETMAEVKRTLKPGGKFIIVPMAIITGKSIPHRFAAFLFRITGQSGLVEEGLQHFCNYYEEAGFKTEVSKNIIKNASEVYIVTATKTN
jgi:ubiquinone/menaquinone biosynthesis C-methylase UbiE